VPYRYQVEATPLAAKQIANLRGRVAEAVKRVSKEMARDGCKAMGYRLTGPVVEHLCDRHLTGRWRLIAAFAPDDTVWVLLVGEHLRDVSARDVYRAVYDVVGHEPEPDEKRTKPPCCDETTGLPPEVDEALVDDLVQRSRALTRRR
jgi:hypothetical protein